MKEDDDLISLSETEIKSQLNSLPHWTYQSDRISKTFEFTSFTEAIMFTNSLVLFCNYLDHHPDIFISYKKVRFELTSYSIGGKVTDLDFTVAQKIEDNFQKYINHQAK